MPGAQHDSGEWRKPQSSGQEALSGGEMSELTRVEAALLTQFIDDSGMEYLAESCEEAGVDFDALIEKLANIANGTE